MDNPNDDDKDRAREADSTPAPDPNIPSKSDDSSEPSKRRRRRKSGLEDDVVRKTTDTSLLEIVYTAAKQVGTVAIIYILGYYQVSVAWLFGPVILSVVRKEWRKKSDRRRTLAQAAAMTDEKEVIMARLDELPAWVYFPDVERAEWVNKIIRQLWPNVNHFTRDILKNSVEPEVRKSLSAYKMNGFQFDRVILGSIPFRVGGVKVYDRNVSRNEIIMDIDTFYAGDCDISFVLSGFPGGIKDFQIHGMLRVVMKPLIRTAPLIGGMQIFFLNNPSIDFNLVGSLDVLDMPGLSDVLRKVILEQVANFMVLPNKLPIQLSDEFPAQLLKMPEPEGVLRVHVVEAKDLMKMDIGFAGKGKSDPYALITVGSQVFRSQTIDNTLNPKWDFWCEFMVIETHGQILHVRLYDKDDTRKDEKLGRATVEISSIAQKGDLDVWLTLEEAKHGMVHLKMTWHYLSDDSKYLAMAHEERKNKRGKGISVALLLVFIDSAKNLPDVRARTRPDASAILSVGKQTQTTRVIYKADSPVWEEGFQFMVQNPETDILGIRIQDQKSQSEIGRFDYYISKLLALEDHEVEEEPFMLTGAGPESKIYLSLRLRFLKPHQAMRDSQQDNDPATTSGVGSSDGPRTDAGPRSDTAARSDAGSRSEKGSKKSSGVKRFSVKSCVSQKNKLSKQPSRTDSVNSSTSAGASSTSSKAAGTGDKDKPPTPTNQPADIVTKSQSTPVESQLVHRMSSFTSSCGEAGLGRIQLTLRYTTQRQRLVVVVHRVANLPIKDPNNIPDPYVKLYLLPDRARETKRKTLVMKDCCSPVYDETFEYVIPEGEVNSRQLEVTVVTKKTWFLSQNPVMGQVLLDLSELDLTKASTMWFDLQTEKERE